MKKVSVIIPCYNAEKYLHASIDSVLDQTYKNLEIICVDDGSKDSTWDILQSYGNKIIPLRHPGGVNRGQYASTNIGIENSSGEYISLLDADDVWVKEKTEKQVAVLESNPEIGVVYSDMMTMYEYGRMYGRMIGEQHQEFNDPNVLILNNYVPNNAVMIRRELMEKFNENLQPADHDMWLRLMEKTKFYYLSESLVGYRTNPNQISARRRQWEECFTVLERAKNRYPYAKKSIIKRKAVIYYRLGMHDMKNGYPLRGIFNLAHAGLYDPIRAISEIAAKL